MWHVTIWIWWCHILGVNFILGCLGLRIFLNSAVWWIWFIIPSPLFSCFQFLSAYASAIYSTVHWLSCHGRPRDWMIWDNFSALKPLKISMFSTVLAIQRMRLSKFKRHVTWLITVPSVVTWDLNIIFRPTWRFYIRNTRSSQIKLFRDNGGAREWWGQS